MAVLAPSTATFSFDVPDEESALGLGFYATDLPGIGGRLRVSASDFEVQEASLAVADAHAGGKYTLAKVRATNWETNRLVREIAKRLRISERRIFFAGTKDKRAVTVQNLAIATPEDEVRRLRIRDVEVLETKRVDRAPKIGELQGNAFRIHVRELAVDCEEALARARAIAARLVAQGGFPNFFGPQRFGSVRPLTHEVGRRIVEGDLLEAVWTYIAGHADADPPELAEPRARLWAERDPALVAGLLPPGLDFEHLLARSLVERPDDAERALEQLPRTLTRMFVGAHQSHLFNQVLSARAREMHPQSVTVGDVLLASRDDGMPDADTLVPVTERNIGRCQEAVARGWGFTSGALPGHDTNWAEGRPGEIERAVVDEAGVELEGFRVPDAPWLGSRGTRRALWCRLDRVEVEGGEDADGPYVALAFFLPKGSYATCLLREIMKTDLRAY